MILVIFHQLETFKQFVWINILYDKHYCTTDGVFLWKCHISAMCEFSQAKTYLRKYDVMSKKTPMKNTLFYLLFCLEHLKINKGLYDLFILVLALWIFMPPPTFGLFGQLSTLSTVHPSSHLKTCPHNSCFKLGGSINYDVTMNWLDFGFPRSKVEVTTGPNMGKMSVLES